MAQQLRRALGARLDDMAKADLIARVDELTRANNELGTTTEEYRRDNDTLRARITELEDDLTAARTSLRHMIRAENRIDEAHAQGWLGDIEGLTVSFTAANDKLDDLDRLSTRRTTVHLGMLGIDSLVGRSITETAPR
jgi:predicted nuclease with TOPRIM domain